MSNTAPRPFRGADPPSRACSEFLACAPKPGTHPTPLRPRFARTTGNSEQALARMRSHDLATLIQQPCLPRAASGAVHPASELSLREGLMTLSPARVPATCVRRLTATLYGYS